MQLLVSRGETPETGRLFHRIPFFRLWPGRRRRDPAHKECNPRRTPL